jgi:hypothetical protein
MPIIIDITNPESAINKISIYTNKAIITTKNRKEANNIWNVLGTCIKWSKREEGKNKLTFSIKSCELVNDGILFLKPYKQ